MCSYWSLEILSDTKHVFSHTKSGQVTYLFLGMHTVLRGMGYGNLDTYLPLLEENSITSLPTLVEPITVTLQLVKGASSKNKNCQQPLAV